MKDAMDTYFEEKKERDRQRQLERQRWEEQRDRQKNNRKLVLTNTTFLNFAIGMPIYSLVGIFICFSILFQFNLPIELTALLNLENRNVPGMILCILCFLICIYLFLVSDHMVTKNAYNSLFFALLWAELFALSTIYLLFVLVMGNKLLPVLPAIITQIIFIIAYYSQRKYLQTFTKTTKKKEGQP